MRDVFTENNNQYNLRNDIKLQLPVAKTKTYGQKILNTEVIFCGPYYQKKLKIPDLYLNSNER